MKRSLYILLLTVVLMQSGGIVVFYRIRQLSIKYAMMQELRNEEKNLENIVLSISEFEKCRINRHEIRYQGNMYDIKSSHIKGGNITLVVVNDKKEANILKKLNQIADNEDENKKQFPDKLLKFMTLLYVCPEPSALTFITSESVLFEQKSDKDYFFLADSSSPPPKLV